MLKAIRHAEFTHKQGSFTASLKHILLVLNHKESRPFIACNKLSKPYKAQTLNFHTYKFPLASCSLSNASNNALKFPFPKLLAPLR